MDSGTRFVTCSADLSAGGLPFVDREAVRAAWLGADAPTGGLANILATTLKHADQSLQKARMMMGLAGFSAAAVA